jgi:hypothetical protein
MDITSCVGERPVSLLSSFSAKVYNINTQHWEGKMKKKYAFTIDGRKVLSINIDGLTYDDPEKIPDPFEQHRVEEAIKILTEPTLEEKVDATTKIVFSIFLGVTILMAAIFLISSFIIGRNMAREKTAEATVVGLMNRKNYEGNTYSYPVVEFTLPDASVQTVTLSEGSWPPAYVVGQPVTVRYNPERINDADVQSAGNIIARWTLPIIMALLTAAFTGALFFIRWIMKQ